MSQLKHRHLLSVSGQYGHWQIQTPQLGGNPPLPSPPLPPLLFPFPFPSPSVSLEVGPLNTARRSGECCKLSQRGLGRSSNGNRIWCILALNLTSDATSFTNFMARLSDWMGGHGRIGGYGRIVPSPGSASEYGLCTA